MSKSDLQSALDSLSKLIRELEDGSSSPKAISKDLGSISDKLKSLETGLNSPQNDFLFAVLAALPSLVSYVDRALNYLYVNEAYERWFGVTKEQCLKSSMQDIIGEVGVQKVRPYLDRAFEGVPQEFQKDIPYKYGGTKTIHVKYIPDFDKNKNVKGLIVVVDDVTEKVQSEVKFNAIYNQSADSIMTLAPPSWKFTGCNSAALRLFGVPDEATFTSLGPWDLSPDTQPDGTPSAEKAPKMIATAMERGSHFFDWEHKTLSGSALHCTVLLSRISTHGNVYLQATVRDVSNERAAVAKLKLRTDELNGIISNSPLGIVRLDSNYRFLSANPAFEEFLGYSESELKSRTLLEFTHPEDFQQILNSIESSQKQSSQPRRLEKRYIHRNGKIVWGLMTSKSFADSEGRSTFLSIIEDITEAKQTQIEVDTVFETMSEGLIIQGESGDTQKFNPEALKILGITESQILGKEAKKLDWKSVKEDGSPFPLEQSPAAVALQTGKPVKNSIMGLTLPSGEERWIKVNAIPFQGATEKKVACTFVDITDLLRANRDIQHIFRHTSDLMCIAGLDGLFKKISPSFEKALGWTETELLSRPFLEFIHPDDSSAAQNELQKLSLGKPTIDFEARLRTKSGTFRLFSWVCEPDIKTGLLYATGRDVTEQRRSEIRNREILNAIDRAAIVAFTDTKGTITHVNDNFCKISKYSRTELLGQNHRIINSGSHSKAFFKNLWQKISSGQVWIGDIENKSKLGEHYFVRTVITPLKDVNGEIEQYMSVRFDVTEQKQIESRLIDAQSIAKIGSWQCDLITGSQIWSSENYRIFEIPETHAQEDLLKLCRERIHPDDLPDYDKFVERAIKHGEDFVYSHRLYLENGSKIKHVRGIGKVTKDPSGRPICVSGTCQDLTDLVALQEQNRFVLDAMGIGIWKFNPVTQDLFWDQSMYRLFEVTPELFSGHYQAWEGTLTPEAKTEAVKELQLALSGEKEFNTTFEIQTRNGRRKHIGGRGIVIRNDKGQPIMMYGINWDRSHEVKNERELKAALDLNEAIRRSAKFSIITTTLDGTITGFNEEAERILGYTAYETVGKCKLAALHDPLEIASASKLLSEELRTQVPVGFETFVFKARMGKFDEREWTYIRKDGKRVPVLLNITGLFDTSGTLYGFMGIARDITDQVALRSQLELEQSKSLHNAKLASLGEMSAGVAHEINNPLAIIAGSLSLLERFKDNPEKFKTKLESIQKSTSRIEKIVKGLKKFSRSSEKTIHKNESLNEILSEVIVLTEAKSKRHSTPIEVEIEDGLIICCDGVEIEQVLINMINNAIDAVKKSRERWVKLKCFSDSNSVVIQVIDSGKGISDGIEAKLFQPFFTTKPVGEGTGLGLSIVKGILDQHKATITINRSFANTCFEIRFQKQSGLQKS